jgi:hypothetical protein
MEWRPVNHGKAELLRVGVWQREMAMAEAKRRVEQKLHEERTQHERRMTARMQDHARLVEARIRAVRQHLVRWPRGPQNAQPSHRHRYLGGYDGSYRACRAPLRRVRPKRGANTSRRFLPPARSRGKLKGRRGCCARPPSFSLTVLLSPSRRRRHEVARGKWTECVFHYGLTVGLWVGCGCKSTVKDSWCLTFKGPVGPEDTEDFARLQAEERAYQEEMQARLTKGTRRHQLQSHRPISARCSTASFDPHGGAGQPEAIARGRTRVDRQRLSHMQNDCPGVSECGRRVRGRDPEGRDRRVLALRITRARYHAPSPPARLQGQSCLGHYTYENHGERW